MPLGVLGTLMKSPSEIVAYYERFSEESRLQSDVFRLEFERQKKSLASIAKAAGAAHRRRRRSRCVRWLIRAMSALGRLLHATSRPDPNAHSTKDGSEELATILNEARIQTCKSSGDSLRGDLTSEFLIARPSRVKSLFGFVPYTLEQLFSLLFIKNLTWDSLEICHSPWYFYLLACYGSIW